MTDATPADFLLCPLHGNGVSRSASLSVHPLAYVKNHASKFQHILAHTVCHSRPWLGPLIEISLNYAVLVMWVTPCFRIMQCCSGLMVSAPDCGVRRPRFESHRGRLCSSRMPLRYAVLGTGCAFLLQRLGQLSLASLRGS